MLKCTKSDYGYIQNQAYTADLIRGWNKKIKLKHPDIRYGNEPLQDDQCNTLTRLVKEIEQATAKKEYNNAIQLLANLREFRMRELKENTHSNLISLIQQYLNLVYDALPKKLQLMVSCAKPSPLPENDMTFGADEPLSEADTNIKETQNSNSWMAMFNFNSNTVANSPIKELENYLGNTL